MRPPERYPRDDPREWMNRANSNLARARVMAPEVYLEDLCFDAQQAAEKALKAVMMSRESTSPTPTTLLACWLCSKRTA